MKIRIIIICLYAVLISPLTVKGEEYITLDDFEFSDSQEVIYDSNIDLDVDEIIEKISKGEILEVLNDVIDSVRENVTNEIEVIRYVIITMIFTAILSGLFSNFSISISGNGISEMGFYVCYVLQISILINVFNLVCSIGSELVLTILKFMSALLPSYMLSVGILGQASATGFYQITLIVITVVELVIGKFVIPLLKIYMVINLVNSISKEDLLSKTAALIKNAIVFVNKFMITSITGLNIIQGMILPAIDGTKNNVLKKMVSSIPVIGDGTGVMAEIVVNSATLIKNSIGVFAIVMILAICAVPLLKVQFYSIMLQISNALLQPITDKRIAQGITATCDSIKILTSSLFTVVALFLVSITVICISTGI